MRRWSWALAVVAVSAQAAPVTVDLRDGSRLVGELEPDSLSIATQYGPVKVKLADLVTATSLDDNERIEVRVVNGDLITGVPTPPKLELKTSFGKVSVPFLLLVRLQPGAPPPVAVPLRKLNEPTNGTEAQVLTFRCSDLKAVSDLGQTTGGSVYLWEANLATGPLLLMLAASREPGAANSLSGVARAVAACKGSGRRIVVRDAKYVSGTETTSGVRAGWTAFSPNISVQ